MKNLVRIIFLINTVVFYSQGYTGTLEVNESQTFTQTNLMREKFKREKDLIGSEYLYKGYKQATITTANNKVATLNVRFNALTHEFEILKKGVVLALKHNIVKSVAFEGEKFVSILDENSNPIFAKELVVGKLKFYKKYKVIVKKEKIIPGIQTETPKDRIVIRELFIVSKSGEDVFSLLKLKKKPILKVLNHNSKTISFSKVNKLAYTKEKDVVKMFIFFNQL